MELGLGADVNGLWFGADWGMSILYSFGRRGTCLVSACLNLLYTRRGWCLWGFWVSLHDVTRDSWHLQEMPYFLVSWIFVFFFCVQSRVLAWFGGWWEAKLLTEILVRDLDWLQLRSMFRSHWEVDDMVETCQPVVNFGDEVYLFQLGLIHYTFWELEVCEYWIC